MQYFVVANEVKQFSTAVIQDLLGCRVLPRFAASSARDDAITELARH
jgi:hypothetical protein